MSSGQLYKVLLITILVVGCGSSLRIRDFTEENTSNAKSLLTSQINYSRNMFSTQEIKPPLTEEWEESYPSAPFNGFTATENWLFFGMQNGYLAAVDIDDGDLEGKKNLGDACAVPPTIYNNILYQTFETGSYGLIAYDVTDGSSIWTLENHFSRSAPMIVNDLVLFQSLKGEIIGLNYENGEEIWRQSLQKDFRNSPAYNNNMMVSATLDGSVFALDPTDGSIIWRTDLNSPVFADPVIEGAKLYVASHDGKLQILDLKTGKVSAKKNINIELFNSPTVDQKSIFISTSNGTLHSINKITLEEKWTFSGDGPIYGSALVTDSYVYIATLAKKLYIIDKNDGALIQKIELVGRARSAPIISQGKLILACETNQVIAYVENQ